MSDPEWRTRGEGQAAQTSVALVSVSCPLVSSPFEGHSLPSLLDGSRKVDLNNSVSATSTMIKAWPVLLLCSGIPVRILGKMAHVLH